MAGSYRCPFVLKMTTAKTAVLMMSALITLSACPSQRPVESNSASNDHLAHVEASPAEPGYTVDVEVPPNATRGEATIARVRVAPKAPWHMNLEYPAKMSLEATDGVELDAPLLRKGDAERYDDDALVFSVLFTPSEKGAQSIAAKVDFAVCGDSACGPVTESVELAFEVACRAEDTGLC